MPATCLTPNALSVLAACSTEVALDNNPVAEAKFLNAPVVLFHAVAVVVNVWAVPKAAAVAPVLTVKPAGRPDPIVLKFSE